MSDSVQPGDIEALRVIARANLCELSAAGFSERGRTEQVAMLLERGLITEVVAERLLSAPAIGDAA